jgi:hypothetical protein
MTPAHHHRNGPYDQEQKRNRKESLGQPEQDFRKMDYAAIHGYLRRISPVLFARQHRGPGNTGKSRFIRQKAANETWWPAMSE